MLADYLRDCRSLVLEEIREIIPGPARTAHGRVLYDLMLEYPLREAKGLRPAICIATCRALGGPLDAVLPTAAVLELYHNAFLIHDDVEDGSEQRRDSVTLHRKHGLAVAVNVGDAMLAIALRPLLDNMKIVGMGKALRILRAVADMARESAEGQAIELDWVRSANWTLTDAAYLEMAEKKTGWYSFITPMMIGAIVAEAAEDCGAELVRFGRLLGVAFQIHDDVLNLRQGDGRYGKEVAGDLWEGKHTLILLHALRASSDLERARACAILRKRRPATEAGAADLGNLLERLSHEGHLSLEGHARVQAALEQSAHGVKAPPDVEYLLGLIHRHGSLEYARGVAVERAREAAEVLTRLGQWMRPSVHRDVLGGLVDFVVTRDW